MKEDINYSLDIAIMLKETAENAKLHSGYYLSQRDKTYWNYMSNECWDDFKNDMQNNHAVAYDLYKNGGGKELEERVVKGNTCPPKMASFGSSSRMIYNLMKSNPDFLFEKKLHTTIGGTANLDGYIETKDKNVFVEAKCREPYSTKQDVSPGVYRKLYEYLSTWKRNNLSCKRISDDNPYVKFYATPKNSEERRELTCFDIKQMICHLLGIATAYLKGDYQKDILFIYLLYNPKGLFIEKQSHRKKIMHIYENECKEWKSIEWAALFEDILRFLAEEKGVGLVQDVNRIAARFSYELHDQFTMPTLFS